MSAARTISVNRWGNGLGIRLPKEFTDRAGITESSKVEAVTTADGLMITRAVEPYKHIPLSEGLKDWEGPIYELTAEDDEWLSMESVGEEVLYEVCDILRGSVDPFATP